MTALRAWWNRWKITILFVGLVAVSLSVYRVNDVQNDRRVVSACESVTQVKDAALKLTKLTSETGVTDPATLARIRVSNAAKTDAREQLERGLACR